MISMRGVAARLQDELFEVSSDTTFDPVDLIERPILVACPLDYQCRANDVRQIFFNVPIEESWQLPYFISTFEAQVRVHVMTAQAVL